MRPCAHSPPAAPNRTIIIRVPELAKMISASANCVRFLLLTAISAAAVRGAVKDIAIPLDNGTLVIHNLSFRGSDNFAPTGKQLLLSFVLENHTSSSWNNIDLEFKMGGFCNGEPREWSYVFHSGFLAGTSPTKTQVKETVGPLPGTNMECDAEIIKARLIFGTLCDNPLCLGDGRHKIEGRSTESLDIEKEFELLRAKRAVEAQQQAERVAADVAAEAERSRQAAAAEADRKQRAAEEKAKFAAEYAVFLEVQAKKNAAEAVRQEKKQAEVAARNAKMKADKDAQAAEERTRVRAACSLIYKSTADKKVGDLTVKEEQQVRFCQSLGLYPPR